MLKIVKYPPYQGGIKGGRGRSKAKSIFYLIRTTYLTPLIILAFSLKTGEYLDFPRINILAMAKSLTEPELKQ
jgi:hypothetical protein